MPRSIVLVALMLGVAAPLLAADADPDAQAVNRELRDRVERLEREIDRLKDAKNDEARQRRDRIERERRQALRLISLHAELDGVIDAAAPLYPQRDAARNELAAAMAAYDAAAAELAPLKEHLDALVRVVEQRRRALTLIEKDLAEDEATAPAMAEARSLVADARAELAKAERRAAELIAADTAYRTLADERAALSAKLDDADDTTVNRPAVAQRLLELDGLMSGRAEEVADLSPERGALREAATTLKLREDDARASILHDPLRVAALVEVNAAQADVEVVQPRVERLEAQVAAADRARRIAAATLDDLDRRIGGLELRAVQLRREIALIRRELRL